MKHLTIYALTLSVCLCSSSNASSPMLCEGDDSELQFPLNSSSEYLRNDADVAPISQPSEMSCASDEEELGIEKMIGSGPTFRVLPAPFLAIVSASQSRGRVKRSTSDAELDDMGSILMDMREDSPPQKLLTPEERNTLVQNFYYGRAEVTEDTYALLNIEEDANAFMEKFYKDDVYVYFVLKLCHLDTQIAEDIRDNHMRAFRDANLRANKGNQRAAFNMFVMYHYGICVPKCDVNAAIFAKMLPEALAFAKCPGQLNLSEGNQGVALKPGSDDQFRLELAD
jgi:hypothetical protein